MELMTYKCPNCGGAILFESKTQQFQCESCMTAFTQEQLNEYDRILRNSGQPANTQPVEDFDWQSRQQGQTLDNVNTYVCQFCGAEIITDPTTAATECPYCNNPIIVAPQLSGGLRPDVIIPFKVTKEQAKQALNDFYKGKIFLPSEFKKANKVREIKGVYVPFWLFNCTSDANITYNATKVTHWSDSDYRYTKTDKYKLWRSGSVSFSRVPADSSEKMDDSYMDALEPFNYTELVPFDAAYLSGYMADRYDVTVEQSKPRIHSRISATTSDMFRETVKGYTTVTNDTCNIGISSGDAEYALMPVWMMNTKYKDKMYTFAINGQTGKLVGSLPVDKKKFWACFIGIASVIVAISQFFLF